MKVQLWNDAQAVKSPVWGVFQGSVADPPASRFGDSSPDLGIGLGKQKNKKKKFRQQTEGWENLKEGTSR